MKKFIFIAVFSIACISFAFCNGISDYMESNVGDGYRVTFSYNGKENMILVRNNKVLLTVNSEEEREAILQMMAEEWFTERIDNTSDRSKALSVYNALYDSYFSVHGEASYIKEDIVLDNVKNNIRKGLIENGSVFQVGTPDECDISKYEEAPYTDEELIGPAIEAPVSEEIIEESSIKKVTVEVEKETETEELTVAESVELVSTENTSNVVTEAKLDLYVFELLVKVLENGININIPVAEPVQKERKEYKNHVTMSASMQMYDVNYYNNVIPLGSTETTFHSNVSSFFGVSYRHAIEDNVDLGVSTGLSFTTDKSEMFLNTPITIDCRYNFKNMFTAVKVGGLVTYNENSISIIPSVGAEIGCVFCEEDISLEVSCGISSGIWMFGTGASKSYILTEFMPVKVGMTKGF